jgi:hypothetical protein
MLKTRVGSKEGMKGRRSLTPTIRSQIHMKGTYLQKEEVQVLEPTTTTTMMMMMMMMMVMMMAMVMMAMVMMMVMVMMMMQFCRDMVDHEQLGRMITR